MKKIFRLAVVAIALSLFLSLAGCSLEEKFNHFIATSACKTVYALFGDSSNDNLRSIGALALFYEGYLYLESNPEKSAEILENVIHRYAKDEVFQIQGIAEDAMYLRLAQLKQKGQKNQDDYILHYVSNDDELIRMMTLRAQTLQGAHPGEKRNTQSIAQNASQLERLFASEKLPQRKRDVIVAFDWLFEDSPTNTVEQKRAALDILNRGIALYPNQTDASVKRALALLRSPKLPFLYEALGDTPAALQEADAFLNAYCFPGHDINLNVLCFRERENSIEPALSSGNGALALERIDQVLKDPSVGAFIKKGDAWIPKKTSNSYAAIMRFFLWSAKPEDDPRAVRDALVAHQGRFTWHFESFRRYAAQFPEPRKKQATCFMDYIQENQSAEILDKCLQSASGILPVSPASVNAI
jgi:hypothetical protein